MELEQAAKSFCELGAISKPAASLLARYIRILMSMSEVLTLVSYTKTVPTAAQV
jgi:hypothetical protein